MKSKSCKRSLLVFFNILDLAGINIWVLCKETTSENILREFLFQLELGAVYQQSQKENHVLKLSITSDSYEKLLRNIVMVIKNYKNLSNSKCEKYMCNCTFENKLIYKKCSETK